MLAFCKVLDQGHDESDTAHGVNFITILGSIIEVLANERKDLLKRSWGTVDVIVELHGSLDHVVNQWHRCLGCAVDDVRLEDVTVDDVVEEAPHQWADLLLVVY